jgi:hypothetical protein
MRSTDVFMRFYRIKGSGLFNLDEFCALTGRTVRSAITLLANRERAGIVIRYDAGIYLLKPIASAPKPKNYDWQPQQDKLDLLWSMLSTRRWTSKQDITKHWKYSDTALTRYLRALRLSGNIKHKMVDKQSFYQKSKPKMQLIASWQELTRRNNV